MIIQKLARLFQLDKSLAFALAARLWQVLSGPLTIALIIATMSSTEQGIYYGIIPIIGIQAFFELGLLNVLISHAGHASAQLTAAAESSDERRREAAAGRMAALIDSSHRWFSAAGLLFAAAALAFGWLTFSRSDAGSGWQGPLIVAIPLAALNVMLSPRLAILEGAGHRDLVYRFRFGQMVVGSVAVWLALVTGLGVWALVLATAVQTGWTAWLTLVHRRGFFLSFRRSSASDHFCWRRDVLPQQWRAAVVGAAYHLATQFLAIVVLTYHGTADAGRLGMTLSITTAIQMLSLAWVQTKYPLIAALHGEGRREEAGTLWRHTAIVSSGLLVTAFAALAAFLYALPLLQRGWESRFIEPWQLIALAAGCLANHAVAVQAFYVLARGGKPLVVASLVGFLSTAAAVWIGGIAASVGGVVIAFAAGFSLLTLPLHTWAYRRFRQTFVEPRPLAT